MAATGAEYVGAFGEKTLSHRQAQAARSSGDKAILFLSLIVAHFEIHPGDHSQPPATLYLSPVIQEESNDARKAPEELCSPADRSTQAASEIRPFCESRFQIRRRGTGFDMSALRR